jgi:acyl-CoA thioesterase FadM
MAPLRTHSWRTEVGDADLPDDHFSDHVNNARYFDFINRCFRSWYCAMGIRGGIPGYTVLMVRSEYDFLQRGETPERHRMHNRGRARRPHEHGSRG